MNTKRFGEKGENIATAYLKKNKYKILDRNYRTKLGEIDIVALKGKTICFVEVKYRTTISFGLPRESVTITKQNKIRRAAQQYLLENKMYDVPVEFDVLEITNEGCNLILQAFWKMSKKCLKNIILYDIIMQWLVCSAMVSATLNI